KTLVLDEALEEGLKRLEEKKGIKYNLPYYFHEKSKHPFETLEWLYFHNPAFVHSLFVSKDKDDPIVQQVRAIQWCLKRLTPAYTCRSCQQPVSHFGIVREGARAEVSMQWLVCDDQQCQQYMRATIEHNRKTRGSIT